MRHQRTPEKGKSPEHCALGLAVRQARARHGISQEELGFRSTLHRNYVGAIERGEINPTFRILLKLAGGLDIPLSLLIRVYERNNLEANARGGDAAEKAAVGAG